MYLFLRSPVIKISNPDVDSGTPVDVSCHVVEVELSASSDSSAVPTFCNPSGQITAPPTYTASITWNVTIEGTGNLNDAIAPYVGKVVTFEMYETGATHQHRFAGTLPYNPAAVGSFTPGERVTSDVEFGLAAEPVVEAIN